MRVVTDHEELELIGEGLPIFHGVSAAASYMCEREKTNITFDQMLL